MIVFNLKCSGLLSLSWQSAWLSWTKTTVINALTASHCCVPHEIMILLSVLQKLVFFSRAVFGTERSRKASWIRKSFSFDIQYIIYVLAQGCPICSWLTDGSVGWSQANPKKVSSSMIHPLWLLPVDWHAEQLIWDVYFSEKCITTHLRSGFGLWTQMQHTFTDCQIKSLFEETNLR